MITAGAPASAFDRDGQRARKRQAVVRAAASAFNTTGFANTSMEDVADALGISKPTLYQYFRSKQEILFECHLLAVQHGEAGVEEAARCSGTGLDQVLAYVRRYMLGFFDDLGACAVLLDVSSLREEQRAEIVSRRDAVSDAVEALIARGVADESIAADDPKLVALFIFGVVNWMSVWYRAGGPHTPEFITELYVSILLRGLRSEGGLRIGSER